MEHADGPRRRLAAVAGLVAGGLALGVAELVAALTGGADSPVVAVGGVVVDATPRWLKEFAIGAFGTNDKTVLLSSVLVVIGILAAITGMVALRWPTAGLLGVAALGAVGAFAALSRPGSKLSDVLPSLVGAVAGMVALRLLLRPLGQRPAPHPEPPSGEGFDRRAFLVTSLAVAAVGIAAGTAGRMTLAKRADALVSRAAVRLPRPRDPAPALPAGTDLGLRGLTRFRTPNAGFYRIDTALVVPQLRAETWSLRVHGMVDRELRVSFDDLLARDLVERDITLACVSNEVGGDLVGSARWLGAPLADLLREAGVHPDADQVLSRSVDGLTIGTPTAVVMDGRDALLAVGMNGEPLPPTHGFPVRMVVPGLYGYVSATKWVVDIELTRFETDDAYWVQRGWVAKAPIKTASRIDTPRSGDTVAVGRVAVAGVAWAQHRGIDAVEVRIDGGPWREARLAAVPSTDTWRQWVYVWDAAPGDHKLEVRATDSTGAVQQQRETEPFPSGATGWHSRDVTAS